MGLKDGFEIGFKRDDILNVKLYDFKVGVLALETVESFDAPSGCDDFLALGMEVFCESLSKAGSGPDDENFANIGRHVGGLGGWF